MKKTSLIRDFLIAVVLVALALFLIGYVKKSRIVELVPDEKDVVKEKSVEQEEVIGDNIITGVKGKVLVGPQCPVSGPEVDCPHPTLPFVGVVDLLVNDPERELIARVRTDTRGFFTTALLPGEYIVVVQHEGTFPVCPEEVAAIKEGSVTDVAVKCDSGIR